MLLPPAHPPPLKWIGAATNSLVNVMLQSLHLGNSSPSLMLCSVTSSHVIHLKSHAAISMVLPLRDTQ